MESIRRIVEVAELFADGAVSQKRLRKAIAEVKSWAQGRSKDSLCGWQEAEAVAALGIERDRGERRWPHYRPYWYLLEDRWLIALLREVFGNPFRVAVPSPDWLSWNRGTVLKMAESIYEERRFCELPILGDALQDAGCDDAEILRHCREPGEHVRGCWVVDLLLGKK
jgi:hypothetical protein